MASSGSTPLNSNRAALCPRPASSAGHPASQSFALNASSAASESTLRTVRSLSPYVPLGAVNTSPALSASLQSLNALASTNAAMFGGSSGLNPAASYQNTALGRGSLKFDGHSRNVSNSSHLSLTRSDDEHLIRSYAPILPVNNLSPHALHAPSAAATSHSDLLHRATEAEEDVKPNVSANRLPHCSEPANYGITDEASTTLWDLKDGPDGINGKPPYPYLLIIRIALLSSEQGRLTLQELYDTLENRWPFFDGDQRGWKNSIRHNLSLNECFKKEARHILDPGKGSYWYCDLSEPHCTPRIRNRSKKVEKPLTGPGSRRNPVRNNLPVKKRKRSGHDQQADDEVEVMDGGYDEYNDLQTIGDGLWKREVKSRLVGRSRAAERAAAELRDIKLPVSGSAVYMPLVVIDSSHMSTISGAWNKAHTSSGSLIAPFGMKSLGLTLPIERSTRRRATSAPSPITPNFTYDNGASHPNVSSLMVHELGDSSPYAFSAQTEVMQHASQYKQDLSKRGFSDRHNSGNSQRFSHSNGNSALSVDVRPFGVPGLMPDSSSLPSTAGTMSLETPKTARSIFHHLLRQNSHMSGANKGEVSGVAAVLEEATGNCIPQDFEHHTTGKISPTRVIDCAQMTPSAAYVFPAPPITSPSLPINTAVSGTSGTAPADASASHSAIRQYFLRQQHAQSQQGQNRINIPPPSAALQPAAFSSGGPAGLPGTAQAAAATCSPSSFESPPKGVSVGALPANVIPASADKASTHARSSTQTKPTFPTSLNAGNGHWSPPPSASLAQSPTRAFHGAEYDKLFGGPFGMIFADTLPRRISRAGSIFAPTSSVASATR